MSDQDHLSAEYMLSKTVGLLSRCGHLSGRLQTLMRLSERLLTARDVRALGDSLADRDDIEALSVTHRDTFARRVAHKADPLPLRQMADDLAPMPALLVARQLARESRLLYEGHVDAARHRTRRTLETALRDAGWVADGRGGFKPPPLGSASGAADSDGAALPSLMTHLTAPGADGRPAMDELKAMRLALRHMEATAPKEWRLGETAERLRRTQGGLELRHAALQDEVSALRAQLARLETKKERLTAALGAHASELAHGDGGPQPAPVPPANPSQAIRAQLDALRASTQSTVSDGVRFQSLCHSVVEDMSAARREATRLRDQFRRNDTALKNACAARGIDLDVVMEEGETDDDAEAGAGGGARDAAADANATDAAAGAFHIGIGDRSFAVRFARDGSGRLMHADRAQSALGLLGMQRRGAGSQHADEDDGGIAPHCGVDEVSLRGEGATLEWCAAQLVVLRRRMDSRFALLQSHIDAYRASMAGVATRLERGQGTRVLRQRMRHLLPLLRTNHTALQAVRADVLDQLRQVAARNAQWEARNDCYQRAHREALVLFQRLGQRADNILAATPSRRTPGHTR